MSSAPPRLRRALAALPLTIVWLMAAWPFVLWLVHRQDPVLAVTMAQTLRHAATTALWWLVVGALGLCVLFPPAPAWLRLAWHRTWRQLGTDAAPLRKALAELGHFASAARHLDTARLAWQRGQTTLAHEHVRRALELDDSIASAWHLLGLITFDARAFAEAAAACARAEALDPGHAFGDALLLHGRARCLLGEADGLALLQQHQQRHGGGARSHLWLAEALQQRGESAAAVAALRTAAAKPAQRATPEEQWYRALARVRLWRRGGSG